jgi:hypothetical protein
MKRTLFTSILATAVGVAAVTLASIAPAAANSDAGQGTLAASATFVKGVGSTYTFDVEINARGYAMNSHNSWSMNVDISEADGHGGFVSRYSGSATTSSCYHSYDSYRSTCGPTTGSNLQTVLHVTTPQYSCSWRVRVSSYDRGQQSDHTRDVWAAKC